MTIDEFTTPPISGENIPFKELSAELEPEILKEKKAAVGQPAPQKPAKNFKIIFIVLGIVLIVLIGALIAVVLMQNKPQTQTAIKPSPSTAALPSPEATASGLPQRVIDRRNALEEQIKNADLNQTDLTYPSLDYKIKF